MESFGFACWLMFGFWFSALSPTQVGPLEATFLPASTPGMHDMMTTSATSPVQNETPAPTDKKEDQPIYAALPSRAGDELVARCEKLGVTQETGASSFIRRTKTPLGSRGSVVQDGHRRLNLCIG